MQTTSIEALPKECLSIIIGKLPARERASSAALVCKLWYEAEAYTPYQPTKIDLQPSHLTLSFVKWHLRDGRKLQEVASLYTCNANTPPGHWEALRLLLQRVSTGAPQLHSLELVLMREDPDGRQWKEGGAPLSVRPLGEFGPPFRFLPLVGEMGALRTLCLRPWMCPREDVPLIHHLERLTNLEALELENFRFEVARTDPGGWVEDAGLRLRSALQSLTNLTELRLRDMRCPNLFPSQSMGNLTNLKSLLIDDEDGNALTMSGLRELTGLTKLTLADRPGLPSVLLSLSNLKELSYRFTPMSDDPLVISEAAELTSLCVFGLWEHRLEEFLPETTLQNLRKLTLAWMHYELRDEYLEPEWPEVWNQPLSHLTSLSYHYRDRNFNLHLPPILSYLDNLPALVHLELSATFGNFIDPGHETLCLLWEHLPVLREMHVHVLLPNPSNFKFKRSLAVECVEEVCWAVCGEIYELQFEAVEDRPELPPGVEDEVLGKPECWHCVRFALPAM